jgi:hypothetical protein
MKKNDQDYHSVNSAALDVSSKKSSLQLLGADRQKYLFKMGFRTLRDLLDYEPVQNSRTLLATAQGLLPNPTIVGLVKPEYASKDPGKAVGWPVYALNNITEDQSKILAAIGVHTIGDLAQLGKEADAIVLASLQDNGFRERPSAPAQLLPGMLGSIASSVKFTTFIREVDLRSLNITAHKDCVVALPIGGGKKHALTDIFENLKCPVFHLGYMCDHRQRWINIGTHLGEVVHSVSLAPGESRNIAMVNWRRRQLLSRNESTRTSEQLSAEFVQNRALEEITTAVAREHQAGRTQTESNTSVTAASFVAAGAIVGGVAGGIVGTLIEPGGGTIIGAAIGAGAGVVAGGLVYSGSQALGMIEADTGGDRNIVADVQQRIALSTSQNASVVRSLWSTVVVEDAQSEGINATTSNISNYNHMHALNIEYFEVLQHHLVRIELERVQPLLFLPFTFLEFANFNFIRDYWDVVRSYVEDETLRSQGDTYFVTEKSPENPDLLTVPPEPTPPEAPEPISLQSLQIDVLFNSVAGNTNIGLDILRGNTEISGTESENGVPRAELDGYEWGNRYTFNTIPNAREITAVRLSKQQTVDWDLKYHVRVKRGSLKKSDVQIENIAGQIIASNSVILDENTRRTFPITWKPTEAYGGENDQAAAEFRRAARARAIIIAKNEIRQQAFDTLVANMARFEKRLQNLILRRRHFFTRVILNAIEPEEISQLLEALVINHNDNNPDTGIPLSMIAHTIPLGMTAGSFVLKLKRLDQDELLALKKKLDINFGKEELAALLSYCHKTLKFYEQEKKNDGLVQTDHVYVASGGLFAEAILGRANSAEYLDMERFFNWQDSPIPNPAPDISPVGMESRFQQSNASVNIPQGSLQVINPVTMPDSTGLQNVLSAVQNPNIFRDMSKASELTTIVSNLAALAGQMGDAASKMTGQAAQQALQSATDVGKAAANMAQSLMSQADTPSIGTPSSITNQGAALNKASQQAPSDSGGVTGPTSGTGTATPPSTAIAETSTSDDIVRKAAGLAPRAATSRRSRTVNVRLAFESAYGVPITYDVLSDLVKSFRLFNEKDIRDIDVGSQNELANPNYIIPLEKWGETNGELAIELDYGIGSFKKNVSIDIPASATVMVVTAKISSRDQTITRARTASRTQILTDMVQQKLGVSATAAKKIVDIADFGFGVNFESTDSITDSDSTTGSVSTTVTETIKVPTGAFDIDVKFKN